MWIFAESWGHRSKLDTTQALEKPVCPDPNILSSGEMRKPESTRISQTQLFPKTNPAIKGRWSEEDVSGVPQLCLLSRAALSAA